jgi:hypothetical protein
MKIKRLARIDLLVSLEDLKKAHLVQSYFYPFVFLFGLFYVAIYTLVKMGYLKSIFMPFAYIFWVLQTYCLYYVVDALGSDPFTIKVLMMAMFGYLLVPHLWYYLNLRSEERYEQ